jgi:hypothetical protein
MISLSDTDTLMKISDIRSQDGLIKKIIIRQGAAHPTFWLAKGQHDLIPDESGLELWEGEMEPGLVHTRNKHVSMISYTAIL